MKKNINNILDCFHHIHYSKDGNECVHRCGGKHRKINPKLDYKIDHCSCGKHSINKKVAIGHTINQELKSSEIIIEFNEKCSNGGWHLESGKVRVKKNKKI